MQDYGPPEEVVEAGVFLHPCEGEAVCKLTNEKVRLTILDVSHTHELPSVQDRSLYFIVLQVPYFNAPMYLQNKTQVGKVEEIFGCISDGVS